MCNPFLPRYGHSCTETGLLCLISGAKGLIFCCILKWHHTGRVCAWKWRVNIPGELLMHMSSIGNRLTRPHAEAGYEIASCLCEGCNGSYSYSHNTADHASVAIMVHNGKKLWYWHHDTVLTQPLKAAAMLGLLVSANCPSVSKPSHKFSKGIQHIYQYFKSNLSFYIEPCSKARSAWKYFH